MTEKGDTDLKLKRRSAKGKLTRTGRAVQFLLDGNRPKSEIQEAFDEFNKAYQDACEKHDAFTSTITDEGEFEKQEEWIEECQQMFLNLKVKSKDNCNENGNITNTDEINSEDIVDIMDPDQSEIDQTDRIQMINPDTEAVRGRQSIIMKGLSVTIKWKG